MDAKPRKRRVDASGRAKVPSEKVGGRWGRTDLDGVPRSARGRSRSRSRPKMDAVDAIERSSGKRASSQSKSPRRHTPGSRASSRGRESSDRSASRASRASRPSSRASSTNSRRERQQPGPLRAAVAEARSEADRLRERNALLVHTLGLLTSEFSTFVSLAGESPIQADTTILPYYTVTFADGEPLGIRVVYDDAGRCVVSELKVTETPFQVGDELIACNDVLLLHIKSLSRVAQTISKASRPMRLLLRRAHPVDGLLEANE